MFKLSLDYPGQPECVYWKYVGNSFDCNYHDKVELDAS